MSNSKSLASNLMADIGIAYNGNSDICDTDRIFDRLEMNKLLVVNQNLDPILNSILIYVTNRKMENISGSYDKRSLSYYR